MAPVDIWSVKRYGIERWIEEFPWPVPDEEAIEMAMELDEAFVDSVREKGRAEADFFLAAYKVTGECWQFLHSHLVLSRLRRRGKEPLLDPRSRHFFQISTAGRDPYELRTSLQFPNPSIWKRLAARLIVAVHELRTGRLPTVAFLRKSSWPKVASWGYCRSAQRRYARKIGGPIGLLHPLIWAPSDPGPHSSRSRSHQAFGEHFLDKIRTLAQGHGEPLSQRQLELLSRVVFEWIDRTANCIHQLESHLPNGQTTILASGLGAPLFKCFSVAARRKGHEVVGFTHGSFFGQLRMGSKSYNELAVVDRFVTPTKRSRALFERLRDRYDYPRSRPVFFQVQENRTWIRQWRRLQSDPVPERIESVMFLEFPLTPLRYQTPNSYWTFQLDALIRVSQAVRSLGYRTILKKHPDRLAESEGLYEAFFDELLTEPFERSYDKADAYFFTDVGSTTFTHAAMGKRPVIVLESSLEGMWPDVRASVAGRCRVVTSWQDRLGRVQFDSDDLATALSAPPEVPDYRFVNSYLLPE